MVEGKRRDVRFAAVCLLALAACLIALALALRLLAAPPAAGRDPNAGLGQLAGKSAEETQAEIDRIVAEGMFNISIATFVEFDDGAAEGDVRIENVPGNRYLMQVEIRRDDTGEKVYESGLIEPNHHVERARLAVDLDAGTYPCTAVFRALDPRTEQVVGRAGAKITIAVRQ